MVNSEFFNSIILSCQNSPVGKLLPSALYVHVSALSQLDPILQDYEQQARVDQRVIAATLIKFSTKTPKISYLFYPDFDENPHPVLSYSIVVALHTGTLSEWDYQDSENPPVLHRKETFVSPDYPHYECFRQLTDFEIRLGLLENSRYLGTSREWEKRLSSYGVSFFEHRLVCPLEQGIKSPLFIERHKAALIRKTLSRPVRLALETDLFVPGVSTFFDYGCGYGNDLEKIAQQGYISSGWDPYYYPENPLQAADIVNLGYVINVIENLQERREALLKAWELTRVVLIVAAQVLIDDCQRGVVVYGDGIVTRRNTFQKYYEQVELKNYLEQVLQVEAIPAGLGIYFIFRDAAQAQQFRLSRFYSEAKTPRIQRQVRKFADYQELLTPLMQFFTQRGRLPVKGELVNEAAFKEEFGTFKQGFKVILQVTNTEDWEAIAEKRRQELLLYLALSNFTHRPKVRELSAKVREDFKSLFGGYQQACLVADMMLVSLRDLKIIKEVFSLSPVGKKLKNSLLVHVSAMESLPPLLRLYEGCASQTIGRLEAANVIQFSSLQPKISYLFFPEFDTSPSPVLSLRMDVYLENLRVYYQELSADDNPPVLHEKELLVMPSYPNYERFVKVTQQARDWGLLDNLQLVNKLEGWQQCLLEHCATIRGNKFCWRKDCDPYKLKLLRSQIRARQRERKP